MKSISEYVANKRIEKRFFKVGIVLKLPALLSCGMFVEALKFKKFPKINGQILTLYKNECQGKFTSNK